VVRTPQILAQLDAESVVLEIVKGTSLTGPTTATTDTEDKVDGLILNDGRSTSELCAAVRTGKMAVMAVIRELGYSNFAQGGCRKCSPSNGRQPYKIGLLALGNVVIGMKNRVTGIKNRVTGIINRVTGIKNRVTGIKNRVTCIRNRVTGIRNRVTGIKNMVTGINNRVTCIRNRVTGIRNRVTDIRNRVTGIRKLSLTELALYIF
jgi:archaellum component FlaC